MTKCAEENCPIDALPGENKCIFHLNKKNKSKELLKQGLDAYTQKGLKLISNAYLEGADFSGLELQSKKFNKCNLKRANFFGARLIKVGFDYCDLDDADFQDIIMERVDLRRINSAKRLKLHHAIFQNVQMPSIKTIGETCLYESGPEEDIEKALDVYQILKKSYKSQGQSRSAGHFFEKEMNMRRKLANSFDKFWITILWILCGYGERPLRTFMSFIACIFSYAGLYMMCDLKGPDGIIEPDFLTTLYFSVVTFTSLGYGDILPTGFARLIAGTEALVGIFLISLFVFVFCRKLSR